MPCPEYIGRLEAVGLGKEVIAGTPVAASVWIPKEAGVLNPQFERAEDTSGIGSIYGVLETATVKQMTSLALSGIATDNFTGHLLTAALGTVTAVKTITLTGFGGGTPAKGDNISSAAGSWTATIKKIYLVGTTTFYAVEETSGTIDAQSDVTNGVWTGATSAVILATGGYFFVVQQDNCHPSYTLYGANQVGDEYAADGMMGTFDLESIVGDYVKFSSDWMAKSVQAAAPQTPAFVDDNKFLAKHASVYFADTEADLNAATAQSMQRFKFSIEKNLQETQDLGSVDVEKFNNLTFGLTGDFEVIYRNNDIRDYVTNDDKKAARFALINDNATALYTGGADDIYPSIYVDLDKVSFDTADKTDDNDALVSQSTEFTALPKDGTMIEILLLNSNITGY